MDVACTFHSHFRGRLRSAEVSANTFMENTKYINMQKVITAPHPCDYQMIQAEVLEAMECERKGGTNGLCTRLQMTHH